MCVCVFCFFFFPFLSAGSLNEVVYLIIVCRGLSRNGGVVLDVTHRTAPVRTLKQSISGFLNPSLCKIRS